MIYLRSLKGKTHTDVELAKGRYEENIVKGTLFIITSVQYCWKVSIIQFYQYISNYV